MHEEKQIIEAIKLGDEHAFEQLFKFYYEPLCRFASPILSDIDEAEELVQDVFCTVWDKRASLDIQSPKAYLHRAVRNACLNRIKHLKVASRYQSEISPISFVSEQRDLETHELKGTIDAAIASLPEKCRAIFIMSRFEELKYKEIAEQLDISIKTVENQMGKALRVLKEHVKAYTTALVLSLLIEYFINR